jgi:FkbM family methyltransferase
MQCNNVLRHHHKTAPICLHAPGELISDQIRQHGAWDVATCTTASRLAKRGSILDIGANIGAFSLCVLLMHQKPSHVLSIEATPWNFELLNQTRSLNPALAASWSVRHAALDATTGHPLTFAGSSSNFGGTTAVSREHHPDRDSGWGASPSRVASLKTQQLDDIVGPSQCMKVIKLDVEGFERFVLQGYSKHMSVASLRPCHIVMEWHIVLLATAGKDRGITDNHKALERELLSWGYVSQDNMNESHETVVWSTREATCCRS